MCWNILNITICENSKGASLIKWENTIKAPFAKNRELIKLRNIKEVRCFFIVKV